MDVPKSGSEFGWLRNRVSTLPYVGDGNDWQYSKLASNVTFVKQNDEINVQRECTGKVHIFWEGHKIILYLHDFPGFQTQKLFETRLCLDTGLIKAKARQNIDWILIIK